MIDRTPTATTTAPRALPALTTERVLEMAAPYVRRVLPLAGEEGRRLHAAKRRQTLRWTLRLALDQVRRRHRARSRLETEEFYAVSYGNESADTFDAQLEPPGRANPFRLGRDCLVVLPPTGLFAVYLAILAEVIAALRPTRVCEVGSGSGKNLLYLAPRFPDVEFTGYELTAGGVALARALQARDTLPPNLERLVGSDGAGARTAIRRIRFLEGDARRLPADDTSFDLTFTMLALEQMWPILPEALAEIRRITRRHVVFLEAFREANDWLGRLNLLTRNYFRASVRRVERAGFRRVALLDHLPQKSTFSTAVLVAEVIRMEGARA